MPGIPQDPESDIDFMILVDENETKLREYRRQIAGRQL
jgi:hypothetical protein